VAQRLREEGFDEAYGLREGLAAWLAAGGPTEPKAWGGVGVAPAPGAAKITRTSAAGSASV
jgi:hypothetical protein